MKIPNINKLCIGENELTVNREPDLILQVEGTDVFPIWYNNETSPHLVPESQNRLGKRLDLYPNKDGICEVYFPEKVFSLYAWTDPNCCIDYEKDPVAVSVYEGGYNNPYFYRLKKIFGLKKFIETNNIKYVAEISTAGTECSYMGDIEHLDVSEIIDNVSFATLVKTNLHPKKLDLRSWKPYNAYSISCGYLGSEFLDISTWDVNKLTSENITFSHEANLTSIKVRNDFSTKKFTSIRNLASNNDKLTELPFAIDASSITKFIADENGNHKDNESGVWSVFSNNKALKSVRFANTDGENCNFWWYTCYNCPNLETVEGIDVKYATIVNIFSNSNKVKNFIIKNIGYTDWKQWHPNATLYGPINSINLTGIPNWGADSEENRKTLVDSLLTYSFDRSNTGRHIYNILLNTSTLNRLTDSEKAAITAKGYNLIGQ